MRRKWTDAQIEEMRRLNPFDSRVAGRDGIDKRILKLGDGSMRKGREILRKQLRERENKPKDEHNPRGGRPSIYPPCPDNPPLAGQNNLRRHRFKNGKCSCGQVRITKPKKRRDE
jgi:hypothetical protein